MLCLFIQANPPHSSFFLFLCFSFLGQINTAIQMPLCLWSFGMLLSKKKTQFIDSTTQWAVLGSVLILGLAQTYEDVYDGIFCGNIGIWYTLQELGQFNEIGSFLVWCILRSNSLKIFGNILSVLMTLNLHQFKLLYSMRLYDCNLVNN